MSWQDVRQKSFCANESGPRRLLAFLALLALLAACRDGCGVWGIRGIWGREVKAMMDLGFLDA